jgi:2-aminophenol/2-amino-5-chlorophenol 1,6-dioxygenase alpha subunit
MAIVSAFLVPGSPLPFLKPENPAWKGIHNGYHAAAEALAGSKPDAIAIYSTQWIAVLDQLWQTRPHVKGVHVDENWYDYGDLHYDIKIDTELTAAVIDSTQEFKIRSKGVNYEGFPIDTGTIVANNYLNPEGTVSLLIGSNNVYHDWETTRKLGATATSAAERLGRRVALVGVGGLSGSIFREEIDIALDRIVNDADDEWNRKILKLLEAGDADALVEICPQYAAEARVDMGFKHFAWLLGGIGGQFKGATVHGYGPTYGSGAAVVELQL